MSRLRPGAAGFEDGTSSYLAIAALRHGFAQLQRIGGFPAISQHTCSLSRCALVSCWCRLSLLLAALHRRLSALQPEHRHLSFSSD